MCAAPAESAPGLRCRAMRREQWSSLPGSAAGGAAKVCAAAGFAEISSIFDDEFAARKYLARVAAHAEAFKQGIVHAHVMSFGADDVFGLRIPDDDVGIAACCQ